MERGKTLELDFSIHQLSRIMQNRKSVSTCVSNYINEISWLSLNYINELVGCLNYINEPNSVFYSQTHHGIQLFQMIGLMDTYRKHHTTFSSHFPLKVGALLKQAKILTKILYCLAIRVFIMENIIKQMMMMTYILPSYSGVHYLYAHTCL